MALAEVCKLYNHHFPSICTVEKDCETDINADHSLRIIEVYCFCCIITFSLKIFTFAGIIGILVLLLVNCWGNQLEEVDIIDFAGNSLDVFTISNVNSGSNWLWVHFFAVYFVSGFICFQLHYQQVAKRKSGPCPYIDELGKGFVDELDYT